MSKCTTDIGLFKKLNESLPPQMVPVSCLAHGLIGTVVNRDDKLKLFIVLSDLNHTLLSIYMKYVLFFLYITKQWRYHLFQLGELNTLSRK